MRSLTAALVLLSVCLCGRQSDSLHTVAQRYAVGTSHGVRGDNAMLQQTLEQYVGRQVSSATRLPERFNDIRAIADSFANAGMISVEQAVHANEADLKVLGFENMWERKLMAKTLRNMRIAWEAWHNNPLTAVRLIKAAQNGRVDVVNQLLFQGVSPDSLLPNGKNGYGMTAIRMAVDTKTRDDGSDIAVEDSMQIIELLVDAGGDLDFADVNGVTPLHASIAARRQMVFRHLLQLGARLDALDANGMTPLQFAVAKRNQAAVEALTSARDGTSDEPELSTKILRTPTTSLRPRGLFSRSARRTTGSGTPAAIVVEQEVDAVRDSGGFKAAATAAQGPHENATHRFPSEPFPAHEQLQAQMHELLNRLHATHVSYSM